MDKVAERKAFEASEFVKTIMHRYEWSDGFSNYQIKDVVVNGNVFDFIEAQNDQPILNGAWYGWQAAKAQAVTESNALLSDAMDAVQKLGSGDFVLVSKELTEEMYIAGTDKRRYGGNTADVYKAMIEAQEQNQ